LSQVSKEGSRRARFLKWLAVALVACGAVTGIRFGVFGGHGRPATAVLGTQLAATNSSNNNGNGNGNDPKSFTIGGSVSGLFPGAAKNLPVLITNQNNQDIKVTGIQINVTGSDKSGCNAGNLSTSNYTGPAFIVLKNSSRTIWLPVSMIHNASNTCQGATFTLQYSGTAVKP
jgi:hypothetical protein